MPSGEPSEPKFTTSTAQDLLKKACSRLGLPHEGAELLRFGENAIFRLAGKPLVVRIGRSIEKLPIVSRELCVARWLDDEGVPVARPFDGVAQPVVIDDHPVSVWHLVEAGRHGPGVEELAVLLRQVHALGACPCDLPALDPLSLAERRLQAATELADSDRAFLLSRCDELRQKFVGLRFALPVGMVHGDAHTGNLLGEAGHAVLTDFEAVANGPREWDLATLAMARSRFGLPADAYQRFIDLYGFDVMTWDGYDTLREIRELYMTAWLIQNLAEGSLVADEVALRIATIRNGDTTREWHAF